MFYFLAYCEMHIFPIEMKFVSRVVLISVFFITILTQTATLKPLETKKLGFMNHIKKYSWMQPACKSGFNIFKIITLCDGKIDCSDGSDETIERCSNNKCLPNSFRCSYGACISASETCNGVFNCADGSDEDLNACTSQCIIPYPSDNTVYYSNDGRKVGGDIVQEETVLQYRCTENNTNLLNSFNTVCKNGSWKPFLPTCVERKTSTSTTLQFFLECPSISFRCDYGACISRADICNGVPNCVDGSDENLDLCKLSECMIPYATNLTFYYIEGRKETGGNFVEDGTSLQYLCTENGQDIYNLPKVICRNGSWKPFLPTCAEKGITRRLKTTTTALPITNSATNSKGTVTTESPSNTAVSVEKRTVKTANGRT